jgi:hypothetical protein
MSNDALIEKLSRFTPDPGKLDRDAALFAAGRASTHTGRWLALSGALAASQLAMLLMFLVWRWVPLPSVVSEAMPIVRADVSSRSANSSAYCVLREQALATEGDLPQDAAAELDSVSEPPVRTLGELSMELLN